MFSIVLLRISVVKCRAPGPMLHLLRECGIIEFLTGTIGSLGSYHYQETNMAQTKAELERAKEFIRDK